MTTLTIGSIAIESEDLALEELIKIFKKILKDKTIKKYLSIVETKPLTASCDYTG